MFMLNRNRLYSGTGLLAVATLLFIINLSSGLIFKNIKLDLTANRLYTLSDGTKNILEKLDKKITLQFYFSEKLFNATPSVVTYSKRVRELLEEYVLLSDGNIELLIKNPEPFSDQEAEAMYFNLQGIPVGAAGSLAYFGLVAVNDAGNWKGISHFRSDQEEALEYELSKLVYSLINPKLPVVGLMSGLPLDGGKANVYVGKKREWFILTQLKRSFDIRHLNTDVEQIPDDVDTLMLVYPRNLSDETLFAIDQFVLGGGRALVFLDAFSEADVAIEKPGDDDLGFMTPVRNARLGKLMNKWGVDLVHGFVAADRRAATRIKSRIGGLERGEVDYVAWLTLREENFNPLDFVTAKIQNMVIASAGILQPSGNTDTQLTPLITTSDQSMAIDAASIQFFTSPEELLQAYVPGGYPFSVAVRVTGNVESAFPDGVNGVDVKNRLTSSSEPVNLIVVADTDMLRDMFWVSFQDFYGKRAAVPTADNATFVINALENLSGSNDLINLRSRGKSIRPFDRVAALRAAADLEFRIKERILREKLSETGYKLKQLQEKVISESDDKSSKPVMSPEQLEEIAKFRTEHIKIRKNLRHVQHALSKDIEALGTKLKIVNIALIPLLVIILATILGVIRVRRAAVEQQQG